MDVTIPDEDLERALVSRCESGPFYAEVIGTEKVRIVHILPSGKRQAGRALPIKEFDDYARVVNKVQRALHEKQRLLKVKRAREDAQRSIDGGPVSVTTEMPLIETIDKYRVEVTRILQKAEEAMAIYHELTRRERKPTDIDAQISEDIWDDIWR